MASSVLIDDNHIRSDGRGTSRQRREASIADSRETFKSHDPTQIIHNIQSEEEEACDSGSGRMIPSVTS